MFQCKGCDITYLRSAHCTTLRDIYKPRPTSQRIFVKVHYGCEGSKSDRVFLQLQTKIADVVERCVRVVPDSSALSTAGSAGRTRRVEKGGAETFSSCTDAYGAM